MAKLYFAGGAVQQHRTTACTPQERKPQRIVRRPQAGERDKEWVCREERARLQPPRRGVDTGDRAHVRVYVNKPASAGTVCGHRRRRYHEFEQRKRIGNVATVVKRIGASCAIAVTVAMGLSDRGQQRRAFLTRATDAAINTVVPEQHPNRGWREI